MSQAIISRIFWKELRVQRAFWYWMLGLGIFIQLAPFLLGSAYHQSAVQFRWFSSVDVVIACCFAVGSMAIAFAGETENLTKSLFQRLPVRAADLLVGKVGWALLGTYTLFFIAWVLAKFCEDNGFGVALNSNQARHHFDQHAADIWLAVLAPLPFLVIGLLCGLVLRDVLTTVTVAGAATAVLMVVVDLEHWIIALVSLIVVAVVDVALVPRWLRDASVGSSIRQRLFPARESVGHSTLGVRSSVAWRRLAGSLLWKEWRQARPVVVTLTAVGTAAVFFLALEGGLVADLKALVLVGVSLVPLLYGVAAGRADRRRSAYHLLTNSGVSANAHWLTKHAIWFSLAILTAFWFLTCESLFDGQLLQPRFRYPLWNAAREIAAVVGSSRFERPIESPSYGQILTVILFVVVLLYSLGHLLSSTIPSAMTSLVLGLIGSAGLAVIFSGLVEFDIPWWWTIGLFPLIFLLTGWVRLRDLLVDRNSLAAWGHVATALCVPLFGICCGIVVFRVAQVPVVTLPLELDASQQLSRVAPGLKQSLFVDAVRALTGPQPRSNGNPPEQQTVAASWKFADPARRAWVEANEPARKLALEAAQQPSGDFPSFKGPWVGSGTLSGEGVVILSHLLLDSARKLESENKLEAALDDYVAIARLGADIKRANAWHAEWRVPLGALAVEAMDQWAAHPKQTSELIKRAITRFQQFEVDAPSEAPALLTDWRTEREVFQNTVWAGNNINPATRSAAETGFVRWCLPWELFRLQRLQDLLFSTSLDALQLVERQLRDRQFVDAAMIDFDRLHTPWKWERTTLTPPFESPNGSDWMPIPKWRVNQAAKARMHSYVWAAVDYRRNHHGSLPTHLSDLVPTYFSALPIDPWTGKSFIWEPNGVPIRIDFESLNLDAHQPFIASAGSLGVQSQLNDWPRPAQLLTKSGRDLYPSPTLNFLAPALTIP